jgi:hypothetical protein
MEVTDLQVAAGIAVLVALALCGLWIFVDVLLRVAN